MTSDLSVWDDLRMTSAVGPSAPQAEALIDLDAIAHNVRLLREHARRRRGDGRRQGRRLQPRRGAVARTALAAGAPRTGGHHGRRRRWNCAPRASTHPILSWLHTPDADFAAAIAAGIELGVSSPRHLRRGGRGGPALGSHGDRHPQGRHRTGAQRCRADRTGAGHRPRSGQGAGRGRGAAARDVLPPRARRRAAPPGDRHPGATASSSASPRPSGRDCAPELVHLANSAATADPARPAVRHGSPRNRDIRAVAGARTRRIRAAARR